VSRNLYLSLHGEQMKAHRGGGGGQAGISEGTVRKRVARGTLQSERDQDGSVWMLLDASTHRGSWAPPALLLALIH
jgi:hypothetical protein